MVAGKKLGRYEIRRKIGSGGMGEVFLAHDEQLDRNVALKVLLPEFCCDLERVQRFKLEAKAASALNHPNIITIYEIGEECDQLFIATEWVDGETLREKIENGELSYLESVMIAEQAADALAVAHSAHIIHRDIKPENIMVRRDGYVKILDFGLAKPILRQKIGAEDETIQLVKTHPGMVMGSVRYMSPEQARGKETDERTDVWSLGVVLYEMLTGVNPFDGETVSDSLAALIHIEPPVIEGVPEELQRIIRKALKKKATERYQNIKDFALDLRDLRSMAVQDSGGHDLKGFVKTTAIRKHDTRENETLIHHTLSSENDTQAGSWARTVSRPVAARTSVLPFALIAAAVLLAVVAWFAAPKFFPTQPPKFLSIQASRLTDNGTANMAEISPDGRFVAFILRQDGKQSLVVKQIATGSSVVLVQPSLLEFYQPTFTPDGEFVYYVLVEKGVGTLHFVPTLGGESKRVTVDIDSRPTFEPDGKRFAFIRHNPNVGGDTVLIADTANASPEPFIQTKDVGFDQFTGIDWSPDGKRLLLGVVNNSGENARKVKVATVGVDDKALTFVGERRWLGAKSIEWTKDGSGFVLVGRATTGDNSQVWHVDYPSGEARQITTDTSDYGSASISSDGSSIVATRVDVISSIWSLNPQQRDLKQLTSETKNLLGHTGLTQLPDGRIIYAKNTGKEVNLFSMDENGGGEKQLTSGNALNLGPSATPDGKYVLFSSNRGGSMAIWRMNPDGSGATQLTNEPNAIDGQTQISKDGRTAYFMRQTPDGGRTKIMTVPVTGGEVVPLIPDNSLSEYFPRLSPDGKRIMFHTFEYDSKNGNLFPRVKIMPIGEGGLDMTAKPAEFDISPEFKWSPDGKSITYVNKAGIDNIWSVDVLDRKERPLTDFTSGNITNFLWSIDGKKLFIIKAVFNSDLILIRDALKA